MAGSVHQFGKAVVASGLLTADELKAFWNALPADRRPADDKEFALRLVAADKLTSYQAREVLAGRGDGLLLGDYLLLSELGEGGMGRVFQARHRVMKRVVALKLSAKAALTDAAAVKRFQREVEAAARLEHPHIVTAYDSGTAGDVKYLVMQFVDGIDLAALVRRDGAQSLAVAVDYIVQAARGLAFAHDAGIIHRDVKPANLLVDKLGVVRVLDLGLASFTGADDGLTGDEQVMGTLDYMSPEQSFGMKGVDARTDVYSLGCTLWFLLTTRKLYEAELAVTRVIAHRDSPIPSILSLRSDLPADFEPVMHRLLAKQPQDRYGSMHEVICALTPFAAARADRDLPSTSLHVDQVGLSNSVAAVRPGTRSGRESVAVLPAIDADTDPISRTITAVAGQARSAPNPTQQTIALNVARKPTTKTAKGSRNRSGRRWIATGIVAAAFFLAAGIVFEFKDKEGKDIAKPSVSGSDPIAVVPAAAPTSISSTASPPAIATAIPTTQTSLPTPVVSPSATKPNLADLLTSTEHVWDVPEKVIPASEWTRHMSSPTLTADELCLIHTAQEKQLSPPELMEYRRATRDVPFGPGVRVKGTLGANQSCLSADGLTLYYSRFVDTTVNNEIFVRRRFSRGDDWGPAENLGPRINGRDHETGPDISADGLTLMFTSLRREGLGQVDIWMSRRPTVEAPFGAPVNLGPKVNTPGPEHSPRQLADGSGLLYATMGSNLVARRNPSSGYETSPFLYFDRSELWPSADGRRMYYVTRPDDPRTPRELLMSRAITPAEAAAIADRGKASRPDLITRPGLRFRGGDHLDLGETFRYDGGDLTFEAWLIPDGGSGMQTLVSLEPGKTDKRGGVRIVRDSDRGMWRTYRAGESRGAAFTDDTAPGEAVHLAVVWLAKNRLFFLNGRQLLPSGFDVPPDAHPVASHAWIGARPDSASPSTASEGWKGTLLQTRISSRARYIDSFDPPRNLTPDSDTAALYRFEASSGDTVKDFSTHRRDAEVVGAEWVGVLVPPELAGVRPIPPAGGSVAPPALPQPRSTAPPIPTAYLDDLPESNYTGEGTLKKHGVGPDGSPLRSSGLPVKHSLLMTRRTGAVSTSVEFDLGGRYDVFSSSIMLLKRPKAPQTFRVFGDGKSLLMGSAQTITEPRFEFHFGARVTGVKTLRLEVSGPADDSQPLFLDPRVNPIPAPLPPKTEQKEVDEPPGEWVDVLSLIDPKLDKLDVAGATKKNDWRLENGELHYRGDDGEGNLIWPISLDGPGMEFDVEFTRAAGDRGLALCFPSSTGDNFITYDVTQSGSIVILNGTRAIGRCSIETGKRGRIGLISLRYGTSDRAMPTVEGVTTASLHFSRSYGKPVNPGPYIAAAWRQMLQIGPNQHYVFHKIRARPLQGGSIAPLRTATDAKPTDVK